jgi:hypothetical protein
VSAAEEVPVRLEIEVTGVEYGGRRGVQVRRRRGVRCGVSAVQQGPGWLHLPPHSAEEQRALLRAGCFLLSERHGTIHSNRGTAPAMSMVSC